MTKRDEAQKYIPLSKKNTGPIQLGDTKGRMITAGNPPAASFLYVDKAGLLCVIPWNEAIKRFGPVKRDS